MHGLQFKYRKRVACDKSKPRHRWLQTDLI